MLDWMDWMDWMDWAVAKQLQRKSFTVSHGFTWLHMVSLCFTVHERLFGGDSKDVEMFLIEPG